MRTIVFVLLLFTATVGAVGAVDWDKQAAEDAKQDKIVLAYDGVKPDRWMVCDTVPRVLPDGRIALYFLAGGVTEPSPENFIGVIYSSDNGDTWSELQPIDIHIPRVGNTMGQGPTEVLVVGDRITMFFATHGKTWDWAWRSWTTVSTNNGKTWSIPQPLPGRLEAANFMRPYIITRDRRIMIPFQHYLGKLDDPNHPKVSRNRNNPELYNTPVTNSRNGVLISQDGGLTWSEHGDIRCPLPDNTHLWAEPAIVEPTKGRIVMLIRPRWGGGTTLYKAESLDGGLTWPDIAEVTDIPNPSSKVALFLLGENCVALVHNPNPNHRKPLSLWVSFDGMKTWPYKRILVEESLDGKKGNLNYPEGYVTPDRKWLHLAFDSNRHQAVFVRAKLPPLDDVPPVVYDDSNPMPLIPPKDKLPPKADKKTLDLSLETPKLILDAGAEFSDASRTLNQNCGVASTGNRLWAVSMGHSKNEREFLAVVSSDDGGKNWTKTPRLVLNPKNGPEGLRQRMQVANLWTDPDGKLWLFFDQSMGYFDGRAGVWATVCENPSDEKPVWSTPVRIWHGATLSKPTVLKSGEWLLPVSLWERNKMSPRDRLGDAHKDLDHFRGANVFISTDKGKTWARQGHVRVPEKIFNHDEHSLLETNDGSLKMFIRTTEGIHQAVSTDKGKTWSKPEKAFPHNPGRFHLRRLKSGNILFIRHGKMDEAIGRSHLTAFLSDDDGKTWKGGLLLDQRGGISYPDACQSDDGRIFVTYDRDRHGAAEILLASFTEADILAGTPAPTSVFKQVVSKGAGNIVTVDKTILDMAMETPKLLVNPGPEYDDDHRDYNMTIGIERTPKGRLWAAWVSGGDSDKGFFVLASSDDEGKTWSKPRLAIDPTNAPNGLRRRILVGNLWTDPLGRLWLFFDQSMGYYDGRAGDWYTVCENPDDENPTWSTPVRIWHGMTLCKPTVLKSGEWLLPVAHWERWAINPKNMLAEAHHDLDELRGANVFVSTDQGKTWNRQGRCRFPDSHFDEHMIVEKNDGTLWMLARTGKGIMQSFSTDKGKTWSPPEAAFPHISARFFIRRLKSGNLLFVRHGKMDEVTKGRVMLTAFLSDDDGKTWKGGLVLDERGQVSYPDGFQFPDGRICISYDRNRGSDAEVLMAVFTEEDVLSGTPVSGKTVLKQLVSKARGGKR